MEELERIGRKTKELCCRANVYSEMRNGTKCIIKELNEIFISKIILRGSIECSELNCHL